uniref:Uncharacterized protein n=1 Tax=Arundo donax TaxID=35708 RepID=A0A0A9B9I9_ARUDO
MCRVVIRGWQAGTLGHFFSCG